MVGRGVHAERIAENLQLAEMSDSTPVWTLSNHDETRHWTRYGARSRERGADRRHRRNMRHPVQVPHIPHGEPCLGGSSSTMARSSRCPKQRYRMNQDRILHFSVSRLNQTTRGEMGAAYPSLGKRKEKMQDSRPWNHGCRCHGTGISILSIHKTMIQVPCSTTTGSRSA